VFQVAHDAWVVVLGDVSGKGVPAAVVTSFVRYTIRSLAMVHAEPSELLKALDHAVTDNATDHYCTVVLARLERVDSTWDVALSLAGHPPALVRRPDGQITELGVPGTPVGLISDPKFRTVHHALRDETVTLYTDGVTEARSSEGLFGDQRLIELLSQLPHQAPVITESIAQAALTWQSGEASDDIAIVTFASS
jgi:phosphoserine phosphatase RsbU/P